MTAPRLSELSYYRTGGECHSLYQPRSLDELRHAVTEIHKHKLPHFILGGGTNSLVMDEHYQGAVISLSRMTNLSIEGTRLFCEAGVDNTVIAEKARDSKLAGAAWMNRLPGLIGGTVRMNARCYGGEISQIVTKVTTVDQKGEIRIYTDPKIFRGYKDTVFMTNGDIVASVELSLRPGERMQIQKEMDHCATDRESKGQFDYPTCGCVFKNDYRAGVPSGRLLELAGAKTLKHGGAEVSPGHANFVYNKGGTSRDILTLSFTMRDLVFEKFGIWMEYEMEILGEVPEDLLALVKKRKPSDYEHPDLVTARQEFARSR